MRNPNGFGGIRKLSGKRRRPFAVYITTGWDFVDGKAKQKQQNIGYFATRQEALIALAEYNKSPYDLTNKKVTFKEVYDILFEQQFSKMKPPTKAGYVGAYKKCAELEKMHMADIRKGNMQKIVDDYADKSKSTQANLLKLFHAVFRFALENDIVQKDYSEFVTVTSDKESKDKVPFSREEITTLWDNLNWTCPQPRGRKNAVYGKPFVDSVLVMIYTGCRISELLDLKVEDVHLEERWIDLRGTKTAAARRTVPIHKKIIPLLETRMNGAFLFEADGEQIKYQQYRNSFFYPMCEAFNMKHTPHECRHSFATYAATSKMNKTLLKKIIGHSAQDITEDVYTHTFIEDLVAEIDKLEL